MAPIDPHTSIAVIRGYVIGLFLLFQLKHFIFDWLYQPPWQYRNKGTYGHPGGIVHALQHFFPTYLILYFFAGLDMGLAGVLAFTEFLIHYHVDWAKMNLNQKLGWGPTTSEWFWRLTGFDQLLHQLTYVWLVWETFV